MSRIGNRPVNILEGVTVEIKSDAVITKGPKGEFSQKINPDFEVKQEDDKLIVKRPSESKAHKSEHGLYRSLLNNAVIGVSEGYEKQLELVGVGYKASAQNNVLELSLGYSHNIHFGVPEEIKVTTVSAKGKSPVITLVGIDKQLIGQIAAKIRSFRKTEPYKGKGIRFVGEVVRRKAGKTAAK